MIVKPQLVPALPPSDKVDGCHRERLAIIYVRQSTIQQVERHQESTRLQYGLVDRAMYLGWPRQGVLVIDDDLGKSAASAEGRPGFQRLVAEVGLGHVGLVLGVEMSRLARSCRDWHQLLEICALFDTLIGDADGIYDPASYNDRLLLGLKGTMSEAELHILKARMLEGRRAKAQRGALAFNLPMGYVRRPSGDVILDPDEQVQATIHLIFDVFARTTTLNGLLRHLVSHDIRLPFRVRSGSAKGELEWHRPNRYTLAGLLRNPAYAGAYAYGRGTPKGRVRLAARSPATRRTAAPADWDVLIRDRLPAYISWERYEQNLQQLLVNRSHYKGVVRGGASLLSGLMVCGRCGLRMVTQYNSNGYGLRYSCSRMAINYGDEICQSLAGKPVDDLVGKLVVQALEPSALEVSLRLAEDIEAERAAQQHQWAQRLERARYEVERARRQYAVVEPENRLVARNLERQWEEALATELELTTEQERMLARQPAALTSSERAAIRRLATDIPALWRSSTTTSEDRQAIVRVLLERVLVTVEHDSETVTIECHWAGGHRTQVRQIRAVARLEQLSYHRDLLRRVADLRKEGMEGPRIASALNAEGWRPPRRRRDDFTAEMVRSLLYRQGLRGCTRGQPISATIRREADEWMLAELAAKVGIAAPTLYTWIRRGQLSARAEHVGGRKVWLVRADEAELARLGRQRHDADAARLSAPLPDKHPECS
jgi:DNA invertase Pin-like site-specific DNA recombinase